MDINLNTEIKVYGAPTVPVIEQEDKAKPQIMPVRESTESAKGNLNDHTLHDPNGKGLNTHLSAESIEKLMAQVQQRLNTMGGHLALGTNEDKRTKKAVVQIKDKRTNKVIREFSADELLKMNSNLDGLGGLLFDENA